ncbi:hypothetical protein C4H12_01415 [Capnocytophaga sp. oral taxon 878]|nr:hypothetical protein C4H12_01415 [Capnocytophaga sp. oral taxon 878]
MRKMQCLESFVAISAKIRFENKAADIQQDNVYPSFTVRLSFVIRSFIVRDSYKVLGVVMRANRADY